MQYSYLHEGRLFGLYFGSAAEGLVCRGVSTVCHRRRPSQCDSTAAGDEGADSRAVRLVQGWLGLGRGVSTARAPSSAPSARRLISGRLRGRHCLRRCAIRSGTIRCVFRSGTFSSGAFSCSSRSSSALSVLAGSTGHRRTASRPSSHHSPCPELTRSHEPIRPVTLRLCGDK